MKVDILTYDLQVKIFPFKIFFFISINLYEIKWEVTFFSIQNKWRLHICYRTLMLMESSLLR